MCNTTSERCEGVKRWCERNDPILYCRPLPPISQRGWNARAIDTHLLSLPVHTLHTQTACPLLAVAVAEAAAVAAWRWQWDLSVDGWVSGCGNRCRRRDSAYACVVVTETGGRVDGNASIPRGRARAATDHDDGRPPPRRDDDATGVAAATAAVPLAEPTPGVRSTSVFCIVVPAKPNTTTVARRRSRVRSLFFHFHFTSFSLVSLLPEPRPHRALVLFPFPRHPHIYTHIHIHIHAHTHSARWSFSTVSYRVPDPENRIYQPHRRLLQEYDQKRRLWWTHERTSQVNSWARHAIFAVVMATVVVIAATMETGGERQIRQAV